VPQALVARRRRIEDGLRYAAAAIFGGVFLLLVPGIPLMLFFTSFYGLGERSVRLVDEKLGGPYYSVRVARVFFNPFQGFILDHLRIHDTRHADRLIAAADRVSVSLNLQALARGELTLEGILMNDATLDIPLGSGQEPRLRLDHVGARLRCMPEQWTLTEASLVASGVLVKVSGTLFHPKQFAPHSVSPEGPGDIARSIDAIQQQLQKVHWKGSPPELEFTVSGDLVNTESLRVEHAEFRAEGGEWRGASFGKIHLRMHYWDQILILEKALLDDGKASFQAAGRADFGQKSASLEFGGSMDPGLLSMLLMPHGKTTDWTWEDTVVINGNLSTAWSAGKALLAGDARFALGRFGYRGVAFHAVSGGIALREGKILVRDFHLEGDPGTLDADLLTGPGDNRIRLKAAVYPAKIAPALSSTAAEPLSAMDFKTPLRIGFEGTASMLDPLLLQGSGTLDLGEAAMRGSPIHSLSSTIKVADGAATFGNITLKMGGGLASGEFTYDFKNWIGRLKDVRSTVDPVGLMIWIDPRIADAIRPYRFHNPPELQVSGKVGLRNPDKNDLRIVVNVPGGLDYKLIGKDLPFRSTSGTVALKGQRLSINLPRSTLYGGSVAIRADLSVAPEDKAYGISVHLEDVDFKSVTKLYFDYSDSQGKLTADYAFRAVSGNDSAMTGKGKLLIKDGNVLAMPIFGPLSELLNDIIPGIGYQSARRATADFTVENGVILTKDLLIQGTGFSMIGNGNIHYLENTMAMNMRLNAQGIPGLVLFPVSKILEYESVGSATHPKWRPKLLPKVP